VAVVDLLGLATASGPPSPPDFPALERRLRTLAKELEGLALTYAKQRDSRAVCAFALGRMQAILADELRTAGFDDPGWPVELGEHLHRRFLDACYAYDARRERDSQSRGRLPLTESTASGRGIAEIPTAYQDLFREICEQRSTVMEDLTFVLAVHILHDLPWALVESRFASSAASRQADFHLINDVLGKSIDRIQNEVHACFDTPYLPLVHWLDQLGGSFDELATDWGFRVTRATAWYSAYRLMDVAQERAALEEIEQGLRRFMHEVRDPDVSSPARQLARLARCIIVRFPRYWGEARIQAGLRRVAAADRAASNKRSERRKS
jgi:hypothetical protein